MSKAPHATDTSVRAYQEILDAGRDDNDQRYIAALIAQADDGLINEEIAKRSGIPRRTVNPRVNELLRKGVVERDGTERETDSGGSGKVHYLTKTGERFIRGEVDPEEVEPVSKQRRRVLDIARKYVNGDVDEDILQIAIERHDDLKRRQNPDWEPE